MGEIVAEHLGGHGCRLLFGHDVDSINALGRWRAYIGGEDVPTDIVVLALGVEPESRLAAEAGLRIVDGAVWTNERWRRVPWRLRCR